MPVIDLSAAVVKSACCPEGKGKLDLYDSAITGFVLEVRPTGGKTYYLRYRDPHGRQRQHKIGDAKSISFDKARQAAERMRSSVVLGGNPLADKRALRSMPTVAEMAQRHLDFVKTYKRSWDVDERQFRNHLLPKFGHLRLDQVSTTEFATWLKEMRDQGYAPASVNRLMIIFRHMYNLGKRWGIPGTERNPILGISLLPENNRRERFLSAAETQRLHDALDLSENPLLKSIIALLLLFGCRKRELLDARWEHVDLSRRIWYIPMSKSGKARHVPISSAALAVLEALPRLRDCPYLLPNPKTQKPFNTIYHSWDTARRLAGLPEVRIHDLRHSAASNMISAGQSIYVVGQILGHRQVQTTERYAHVAPDALIAAVEAAAKGVGSAWGTEPRESSS